MDEYHKPVLLREVIEALNVKKDSWYLDCTLGDGGHSLEILKIGGQVVGIDVDPQAIERARKRFETEEIDRNKWKLIVGNFRDINNLISQMDLAGQKFAGAIFDLGVSLYQLETPERGFSFMKEGSLDMRMDPTLKVRALDLINAGGRKELYELFKKLGEEKYSWRLADALVLAREVAPISTTDQLAKVVERVIGKKRGKIHPATRVFQALRIAVNDELEALQEGLDQVIDLIQKNGRIVVISFHSLEDRIVKNTFKKWKSEGLGEIITKKPIVPSDNEIKSNPRSRSAKLRVFNYDNH